MGKRFSIFHSTFDAVCLIAFGAEAPEKIAREYKCFSGRPSITGRVNL